MIKNFTLVSLLFITIFLSSINLFAQKLEAESATLAGGASKISCSSCSGGYAVAMQDGNLSFNVNISEGGLFNIYLTAVAPGGDKINVIDIDGVSGDFSVKEGTTYTKLKVVSAYKLSSGSHKIAIKKSWGWINIDALELEAVDGSERFNLDQTLVTPNPIPEATALYGFLLDHYNKRIISGGMTLNDIDNSTWLEWIKTNTGKEVAVLGLDFMHSVGKGTGWIDEKAPVLDAETWYNRNGIPVMMWHWRDPSKITEDFYTDKTNFDVTKINDSNSDEYKNIVADIDKVAGLIKILNDKNIPLIWRPLHEAAGGWFWWGAKGPEPLKKLWLLMYERMVNHHGLKNLIWVWTAEPGDDEWYPGDGYVDIVGRDIYKDGDHSAHVMEFNTLNDRFGGKKMIALTEHGSLPDPDNLLKDEAAWSWFMPWYADYTTSAKYNSVELWKKTMNHDYVITLDEMPNLRTYQRQAVSEPERPKEPENPENPENPVTTVKNGFDKNSEFKVFPTYVDGYLTVKGENIIRTLKVYNSSGMDLYSFKTLSNEFEVSCDGLPAGLYFLKINDSEIIKFIKK